MIKKNEVLIHECSKRGNILWKNPTKCISDLTLSQCYNEADNVTKPIKEHNHKETWQRVNVAIHLNISIMKHGHATMSQSSITFNENCNLA